MITKSAITTAALLLMLPLAASAQRFADDQPRLIRAELVAGTPYGIGKITFAPGRSDKTVRLTNGFTIQDHGRRVRYPVFSQPLALKILEQAAETTLDQSNVTVWFLFLGDTPLEIELGGLQTIRFRAEPVRKRANAVDRRIKHWWREYVRNARSHFENSDYPPLVETYLTSMLSKRLQLELPAFERSAQKRDELQKTLDLLLDTEMMQADMIRDMMMSDLLMQGLAKSGLPEPIQWSDSAEFSVPEDVIVEPIAKYVPEECFYLRFGTWQNQMWLKYLMEEYGGDLSRMVQLRGHKTSDSDRMLEQLVLESSELENAFAGNAIEDLAVIGMDAYTSDGAAIGVLFQAKNKVFERSTRSKRENYAKKHAADGVTLKEIEFGMNKGTLLSSPDNRVRSFLVSDGQFHLVTTSRVLASRFFSSANGNRSLASNRKFRLARSLMPTSRDDTVFIYISSEFFQNLLSPKYQIELFRRSQSVVRLQLLELAQLAATNEGFRDESIDSLIKKGFLPLGFGQLSDGSRLIGENQTFVDSRRGVRGLFVPIPDVPVESISQTELKWYTDRADFFSEQFEEVDPLVIALKRFELKGDVERVVMDARVAPFGQKKYEWLGTKLGQPMKFHVVTSPNDIISLQASLQGGGVLNSVPPHQIFLGIQNDMVPNVELLPTSFRKILKTLQTTPGYVGAWPNPGYLDFFGVRQQRIFDDRGISYSRLLKLWRMQHGEFSVVSFDDARLLELKQHLDIRPATSPAQIKLHVGDLSSSNLRDWANSVAYSRSWQASIANIQLVNLVTQQLGVPREKALAKVEDLLEVELICPLGGEFVLAESEGARSIWKSTGWPRFDATRVPDDFESPLLNWFRGADIEVKQVDNQFALHAVLDVKRLSSKNGTVHLPSFNLFKGFDKIEALPAVKGTRKPKPEPTELNAPIK